jgi:hypothetical protein
MRRLLDDHKSTMPVWLEPFRVQLAKRCGGRQRTWEQAFELPQVVARAFNFNLYAALRVPHRSVQFKLCG